MRRIAFFYMLSQIAGDDNDPVKVLKKYDINKSGQVELDELKVLFSVCIFVVFI